MSRDLTQTTVSYSWESNLPGKTTRNLSQPYDQTLATTFVVGEQSKTLLEWSDAGSRAKPVVLPDSSEVAE